MTVQSAAIRLGIDLGNTRVRAAYVFPDGGRTVVTLPVSPGPFGGRLPICERLPVNDPYLPPFFPGLSQRIERDFDVRVGHDRRTTMQLISHIVVHTADMARNFSGAIVDGIMLTLPAWQLPSSRDLLRATILDAGFDPSMLAAHSDATAAHVRAEMMSERNHETTLLFSAGYTGVEIAVMRLTQKGHRVLAEAASQGVLAGNCLDFAIINAALHQLKANRILISGLRETTPASVELWTELQQRVEAAKHELDEAAEATFAIPCALLPDNTKDVEMRIDGRRFQVLVGQHLQVARGMIDTLLREADVDAGEVDHIVLEGGGTHLPGIAAALGEHLPRAGLRYLPTDALASGAALLATERDFHERFEPPASSAAGRFVPSLQLVSDLVAVVTAPADLRPVADVPAASPATPNAAFPQRAAAPPAEIADRPIEDMTLTEPARPDRFRPWLRDPPADRTA